MTSRNSRYSSSESDHLHMHASPSMPSTADEPPAPHRSSKAEVHQEPESSEQTWTAAELLEVRARERTFDGAYWRTAVGLFGASLVILRVFGLAFFPVGVVFLALGLGFLGIGLVRRHRLLSKDSHAQSPIFVTSGSTAVLTSVICISAYTALLVLLLRM
ncbi:hypothetical protein LPJ78_002092 [Coemansia sp. RSA 989]|nr:hypothetical protein BX667DRAFT_6905 [Coemansia mojavensis]KAJ1739758.1 hypothetical protein LPJ68_004387 [Coemansia sp. RSA 1086]KAJ1748214.1 hypothetical protein LPJ79_004709 [Coemansia sp. RSA 1821]KAJ1866175.1 hypothetical protein LPJ78_002092 [Coemansia sp. RSA 989]KAJ1873371.1 hypothetical protein LPJ55_002322 [Coemansia sp. RSA 990]KAJ2631920.1 hypothetical protein H4R22_001628 [Coemansia sp. RSA 1290]KAJ2648952.1 hypothetical protein IWW40_003496 [Coemansia sp. RSA 1250]KAJ2671316